MERAAAAPSAPALLQIGAIEENGQVALRVSGAAPGAAIELFAGSKVGRGPCWTKLQGQCFSIRKPQRVVRLVADADGTARTTVTYPGSAGSVVPFQAAIDSSPPVLTGVVRRTVLPAGTAAHPTGQNVLIVLMDDVGVEKLSAYGAETPAPTPTIDSLAATGMVFDHAFTRPVCVPGRASLQTGRYGRRTGVGGNWRDDEPWELGTEQITLAEVARLSPYFDYQTSLAGKWHLATSLSANGFNAPIAQGYQWYAGPYANLFELRQGWLSYYDWNKVVDGVEVSDTTYATTDTIDDAIDRVGAMDEPWLLVVSTNAAHAPFEAPPPELMPTTIDDGGHGQTARRMIEAVDTELGRLLASIPSDVLGRTTVVVTADNGTNKSQAEPWVKSRRAKGTLFDGGVRVPLIVTGVGVGAPGTHSSAPVDLVDLFPTLAEWVGVDLDSIPSVLDPSQPYRIDGIPLTSYLADPNAPYLREYLYSDLFLPPGPGPYTTVDRQVIRDGRYKLIQDNLTGKVMFFHYADGDNDEGQDLVQCGMTSEEGAAYEQMTLALAEITADQTYDALPWPSGSPDTGRDPDFPLDNDTGVPVCPTQ